MPNIWLEGIVDDYDLKDVKRRPERERIIIDFLLNKSNLNKCLETLEENEISLLRYLSEKGGWARLSVITRKFGSMEEDGFYWNEFIPSSSLGFLWSQALVMVGRANLKGCRTKIATIPVELRDLIKSQF